MKRLVLAIAASTLPAAVFLFVQARAAERFDSPLSGDRQILQVVRRLTFGPRPGDVEEVRRIGVEKWIAFQLHPESIPENPVLDARLKPLETLRMDPEEVMKEYSPIHRR